MKQVTLCIEYRNVCTRNAVSTPNCLFSRLKWSYEHNLYCLF